MRSEGRHFTRYAAMPGRGARAVVAFSIVLIGAEPPAQAGMFGSARD
jgi:hypothetical protein